MNLQFEKNKLYDYIGEGLLELLIKHKMYIGGGTITSLLTNSEINDLDVYAKDEETAMKFMQEVWDDRVHIVSLTSKAIQFTYHEAVVQLIHFNYFNKAEDIFDKFDFTVCMGIFDFGSEEFVLHENFLKHNSQRLLKFNSDTAYPIVSLLRVKKYEEKGYSISKAELIRVILTCMKLEINTYEELKEQIGGLYGESFDKLFEDIKDEPFSLQHAIEKIADITLSEDYFKQPVSLEFNDIDDILEMISKKPVEYLQFKSELYAKNVNGGFKKVTEKKENHIDLDANDHFKGMKIYKFVKKIDDKYVSFYDNGFEYAIGDIAVPKKDDLFFSYKETIEQSHYFGKVDGVLIESIIPNTSHINKISPEMIVVNKAVILREVPETEWKQWL